MTILERATVANFGVLLACIFGVLLAWIFQVMSVAVGTTTKAKPAHLTKRLRSSEFAQF
jgi:hypothetical protein